MGKGGVAVVVICTAALVSLLWYYMWCQPLEDRAGNEPGGAMTGTAKALIVINDEHVISWMPLNNFFANDPAEDPSDPNPDPAHWEHEDEHWKGVLIQLGNYAGGEHHAPFPNEQYTLEATDENGKTVSYYRAGPEKWFNLVAKDDSGKPDHAKKQIPPMDGTHAEWLQATCPPPASSGGPWPDCRLTKSLHFAFTPEKILTFWPGGTGYDLRVSGNHGKRSLTFESQKDLHLEVDGVAVQNFGKLKTLTISGEYHNRHQDNEDPVWPIP